MEDSEKAWLRIDQELKDKTNKVKPKKVDYGCPYKNKYHELNEKYSTKYGKNTGTPECENLLDDLRAFERVFRIMKINKIV
jgi:hypothetical protein